MSISAFVLYLLTSVFQPEIFSQRLLDLWLMGCSDRALEILTDIYL